MNIRISVFKTWKYSFAAILSTFLVIGSYLPAQGLKEVDTSVPDRVMNRVKTNNKYLVWQVAQGNYDKAIQLSKDAVQEEDDRPEGYYGLSMVYAQKGVLDSAVYYIEKALGEGLPFARFVAGPRDLFQPLYDTDAFRELAREENVRLVHGPMIGSVTPTSAQIWVRTAEESQVEIQAAPSPDLERIAATGRAKTSARDDYTCKVGMKDLQPDTKYFYQVMIDGEAISVTPAPSFRTAMESETSSRYSFSVGFGGGANNRPRNEHIWDTIRQWNPHSFLFLGDNTYFNIPDDPAHQKYFFYRRQSRPEFQRLTASTAMYFIWDDHDFAGNDSHGGPCVNTPAWKKDVVLPIFKQNSVNPSYGQSGNPGCYFSFSIGDVDFFMLDTRYYREDPMHAHASMLGPVQREWLLNELESSDATFKILASSIPWKYGVKGGNQISDTFDRRQPGTWDVWEGFPFERTAIFNFIEEEEIEGVFLMSADRHRSDAYVINRPRGYDFYEAMTSHLTKSGGHSLMKNAIFSHEGKPMFGLLTFTMGIEDPVLKYRVIDIDNNPVDSLVVRRSQLEFPK